VYVDESFRKPTGELNEMEKAMLEFTDNVQDNSRPSCHTCVFVINPGRMFMRHSIIVAFSILSLTGCSKPTEFVCEHPEATVIADGSLLSVTDSGFDLTVDLEAKMVSSQRYPKFGAREIKVEDSFIIWVAERESDPYSAIAYRLNRYTGTLHISIDDTDKGGAVATGKCVEKKRLF